MKKTSVTFETQDKVLKKFLIRQRLFVLITLWTMMAGLFWSKVAVIKACGLKHSLWPVKCTQTQLGNCS